MLPSPAALKKNKYFYGLTVFTVTLALNACGGKETPKIGDRFPKNGQDECGVNCSQKPTPETGLNAPAYTALALISMKEANRILDVALIALKGEQADSEKSPIDPACQKFDIDRIDAVTDKLTLTTEPSKDKTCFGHSAEEIIEVTYLDANRQAIKKIEKKEGDISISVPLNKSGRKKVSLQEFKVLFTHDKDNLYAFEYRAKLTLTMIRERGGASVEKQKKESNALLEEVTTLDFKNVSGLVSLADERAWQIRELNLNYEREIESRPQVTTTFNLSAGPNSVVINPLSCGLPVGEFTFAQTVDDKKNRAASYHPALQINENGMISLRANAKQRFVAKNCREDGFHSLDDIVTRAAHDTKRVPGKSTPGQATNGAKSSSQARLIDGDKQGHSMANEFSTDTED